MSSTTVPVHKAYARLHLDHADRTAQLVAELYADDPYFTARFGCGHLRYLCYK